MTQISRPFQIALVAMVLFAAVWFVALRGHSSGERKLRAGSVLQHAGCQRRSPPRRPSAGSNAGAVGRRALSAPRAAPPTTAPPPASTASRARSPKRTAPSPQSQQNAKHCSRSPTRRRPAGADAAPPAGSQASHGSTRPAAGARRRRRRQSAAQRPRRRSPRVEPSRTRRAEADRAEAAACRRMQAHGRRRAQAGQGRRDPLLEPEGRRRRGRAPRTAGRRPRTRRGKLAVHVARSSQVGSFGSFTRAVQVYGTPTILMVNTNGQTSSVTGLTDAFSIEQAIKEVKQAQADARWPAYTRSRAERPPKACASTSNDRCGRGHVPAGACTGAAGGAACGDLIRISLALDPDSPSGRDRRRGLRRERLRRGDRRRQRRRRPAARRAAARRRAHRRASRSRASSAG